MQKESTPYKTFNQRMLWYSMKRVASKAFKRFLIYGALSLYMWANDFEKSLWTQLLLLIGIYLSALNGCGVFWFHLKTLFKKDWRKFQSEENTGTISRTENIKETAVLQGFEMSPVDFLKQRSQFSKLSGNKKYKNTIWNQNVAANDIRKIVAEDSGNSICNERDLDRYLTQHEQEKQTRVENGFRDTKARKEKQEKVLKNLVYQPAPLVLPTSQSAFDMKDDQIKLETDWQAIFGIGIQQEQLPKFVIHMKDWISTTILKPLVDEIEYINGVLEHNGYTHLCIGRTPWHLLCSLVDNDFEFVHNYIPRLTVILSYLRICSNQVFLLERLRVLSIGAYLNAYQTSSLAHLPNDAFLIFNFFCIYMDEQLLNATGALGGRPFFDKYVILTNRELTSYDLNKLIIKNQANCAILCTDTMRPKFILIMENRIWPCSTNNNSLFYVLIAFLGYLHKNNQSYLGSVQLGRHGLNMLWILEIDD